MDEKKNSTEAELCQESKAAAEEMKAHSDSAFVMEDEYYGMLEDYWNDSYYAEVL